MQEDGWSYQGTLEANSSRRVILNPLGPLRHSSSAPMGLELTSLGEPEESGEVRRNTILEVARQQQEALRRSPKPKDEDEWIVEKSGCWIHKDCMIRYVKRKSGLVRAMRIR
ncbi:hypothetical protein CYMTET_28270 [Cymbomonas tetramitiformis]|uniref:Uncharacterized protein n=1 Tax=Cymbomonas tetramitiformis TaxID=36881 RepID=A0AAE0FNF8_9CHLO|nr:hypothetical protein CYMTET_28270 [Cymbomonas tetramitiformis]